MSADFDIVIVGAGAAGIGAARKLSSAPLSVLLVEASARIGGRAWTFDLAGSPLDLGCEWLHSGERNAWARLAEASGFAIERGEAAWGSQFRNLKFSAQEQDAAHQAFGAWAARLACVDPRSDCAGDALEPNGTWNAYIQAITGFISGAAPAAISAKDFAAYDDASSEANWRAPAGYGALVAANLPARIALRLATPIASIALDGAGVILTTPAGVLRARAVILTVSTRVLASGAMALPAALDAWRDAASALPLGRNEKVFMEIVGDGAFEAETHALGDPRDPRTGSYYIRPLGRPVIECFFGGDGAGAIEAEGPAAGFAFAADQLAGRFGSDVRRALRPLVATCWGRMTHIGGAYSYARPGRAAARAVLARPFESRVFFAGEATHAFDFSTAHGAYDSGRRAAEEAMAALAMRRA